MACRGGGSRLNHDLWVGIRIEVNVIIRLLGSMMLRTVCWACGDDRGGHCSMLGRSEATQYSTVCMYYVGTA